MSMFRWQLFLNCHHYISIFNYISGNKEITLFLEKKKLNSSETTVELPECLWDPRMYRRR